MNPTAGQPRRDRGFTLIEATASIAIISVLGLTASVLINGSVGTVRTSLIRAELHTSASVALDRLVREVREIAEDPDSDEPAPWIDEATASSIAWSGNSQVLLEDDRLMLQIDGGPSDVLAQPVTALTLRYFDQENQELTPPDGGFSRTDGSTAPIRRISVQITLSRNGVTETLRSKAFIRTMSDGSGP